MLKFSAQSHNYPGEHTEISPTHFFDKLLEKALGSKENFIEVEKGKSTEREKKLPSIRFIR